MKHTDERFFDDTEMDLFLLSLHPPIALFQCSRYVQNICIPAVTSPFSAAYRMIKQLSPWQSACIMQLALGPGVIRH